MYVNVAVVVVAMSIPLQHALLGGGISKSVLVWY